MVKKVDKDAISIKTLVKTEIIIEKNEIRTVQILWQKHCSSYIQKICEFAKDKITSEMGYKKITSLINEELKKDKILDIN